MPSAEIEALGNIQQLRRPALRRNLVRAVELALSLPSSAAEEKLDGACTGARILVIEDHPDTLQVMSAILQRLGCWVWTASTASAGLEILRTALVDLVLVDGQLPEMDGIEFTRQARKLGGAAGATPIVAISGHTAPEWRKSFFEAGADDYLLKPATAAELRDAIRMRVQVGRVTG